MRCYYCARQERMTHDGAAVAICKRCGGGICLDHLYEVRRDRPHVGMLGQAPGQTVELLCLACAGITPPEARNPVSPGRLSGNASVWETPVSASSSAMRATSEPAWTDPASVIVAAETYLARLRAPTRPQPRDASVTPPTRRSPWESPGQSWRIWWRRWVSSWSRREAPDATVVEPPQR